MERRITISGRAMCTPKSLPVGTRVYCAGCRKHYEIDRDTLLIEGFECDCGKLRMPPRFGTQGNGKSVYRPEYSMPSVGRVRRGRGR